MKDFNAADLITKMQEAGLPVVGVASDGRIDFEDGATELHKLLAEEFFNNYDQAAVDAEKVVVLPPTEEDVRNATNIEELKTLFIRFIESK